MLNRDNKHRNIGMENHAMRNTRAEQSRKNVTFLVRDKNKVDLMLRHKIIKVVKKAGFGNDVRSEGEAAIMILAIPQK